MSNTKFEKNRSIQTREPLTVESSLLERWFGQYVIEIMVFIILILVLILMLFNVNENHLQFLTHIAALLGGGLIGRLKKPINRKTKTN